MRLYPIEAGNFKLDGGAMFGVVPKVLWERTNPADPNNQIEMASRCLLVEEGNRLILIDTGMGNKQNAKFFGHYNLWGSHYLDGSLSRAGFHRDEITDVLLTHLHFDHCGGAIVNSSSGVLEPAFKNATFWVHKAHWDWATEPNAREKASFLKENILPIQESGQLNMVSRSGDRGNWEGMFDLLFVDGHTDSQMLPMLNYKGKKLVFMADLLPSTGHIPLPYVMGYDTRPLITIDERKIIFTEAAKKGYHLFLE